MAFCFKKTIFFSYLITVVIITCTASLLNHAEECLALFQFKQTISYQPDVHKFASWRKIPNNASGHDDSDYECCLWQGVVCSKEGYVIGLDLSQSSLGGPINSNTTLFKLARLQMLNLSMNEFVGSQIPPEIALLKQLRILDLSDSGFTGQIPSEISRLVQLSSLDLSWNPLKLQSFGLEYLLQNMTRLEELHLSGVNVSSYVPRFLANFSSLRSIGLRECWLQDEFPSAIFHLPKLNFLSLRNNTRLVGSLPEFHNSTLLEHLNLYKTDFRGNIPESIGRLNHLVYVDLGGCSFSGCIPGSLSNLTQLTYLLLDRNKLKCTVPSLENLSKLDFLELSWNNFDKGRLLLNRLSKMTRLTELYVVHTNICEEIPPSIANLTKLRVAVMSDNFIFGQIPSSLMNLTTITNLDLSGNELQGPISSAFSEFKSLVYLDLGVNKFNGTVNLDTFLGLKNLETLDLGMNAISLVATNNYTNATLPELKMLGLSSCNLKEFPAFLRFQSKMRGLYFYDNQIEGLIPNWIWNNSQETLRVIDFSNNFITGFHQHPRFLSWLYLSSCLINNNQLQGWLPIPPSTTVMYDASKNDLTGEIPTLICEVKSLQYLDLSSNHMTGILPPCLGNLSRLLLVLNLNRNNFHGPMMAILTHGSPLKKIDLSENQFIGQVSKSLAKCTSLQFLSLGDNSFEGLFPFWLGYLEELEILILRSNKFHGEIRGLSSISSQFLKLRILDLSNNSFTGELPDMSFRHWKAMKSAYFDTSFSMGTNVSIPSFLSGEYPYSMTLTNKGVKREYEKILNIFIAIDLSCNNFVGKIPPSLQDLQGLQSLNLSNNHLVGRILPSLWNLKNLESLDFSRNELSGKIPQELLQLGYLAIFNVSFNHLDGRIPQGKQFNTFDSSSYLSNPNLCGQPLSKNCESSKAVTPPPIRTENESLLSSERIDWIIIFLGVGSGLIVGIVFGNILYARYSDWFFERFGLRKEKWVRPLRSNNIKRNKLN